MAIPPFPRTKCACLEDIESCHQHPGYLIPGDLKLIARHLGVSIASIAHRFAASPGAVVADSETGQKYQIGTIIPAPDATGRCNFLDEKNRCTIHDAAPFGCAYFDAHMTNREAQQRTTWALHLIVDDDEYNTTRALLEPTKSYKPKAY